MTDTTYNYVETDGAPLKMHYYNLEILDRLFRPKDGWQVGDMPASLAKLKDLRSDLEKFGQDCARAAYEELLSDAELYWEPSIENPGNLVVQFGVDYPLQLRFNLDGGFVEKLLGFYDPAEDEDGEKTAEVLRAAAKRLRDMAQMIEMMTEARLKSREV
jgi:hypothetical protein